MRLTRWTVEKFFKFIFLDTRFLVIEAFGEVVDDWEEFRDNFVIFVQRLGIIAKPQKGRIALYMFYFKRTFNIRERM